jgi:hypothetical protein
MLSRKGRFLYEESNKIGFAFFCFSYDFLRIFEGSAENPKTRLPPGPCNKFQNYAQVPSLLKTACEELNPHTTTLIGAGANSSRWSRGGGARVRSREAPGGSPAPPGRVGRIRDLTGELLGGAHGGRPPESWAAMHDKSGGN